MSHDNTTLDTILVVDLETTCWEGAPPKDEIPEIIEIGLVELDAKTLQNGLSRSILAFPVQSRVSSFCTQLTGHTQEELVANGVNIEAALSCLREHQSKGRPWASWGACDRNMIEETCRRHGLRSPLSRQHINVKTLFALAQRLEKEVGMAEALDILGQPLEGRHHSGIDDARNIAKILGALLYQLRLGFRPQP